MSKREKFDIIRIIIGIIFVIPLIVIHLTIGEKELWGSNINTVIVLPISLVLYLLIAFDFYIETFKNFKKKRFFDEITLTLIASICAFAVGQYVEGLAVVLFFQIGEKFEEYAVEKSRKSIKEVLDLRADKATLYNNKEEKIVDPYDVNIGDLILVKSGERVPLDGVVIEGSSFLDTSSLTGESVPKKIKEGETILSGVINKGSPLVIKVTKMFYDSTTSKIMDLVENATNAKTKNERFITKFSKYYTPTVCLIALLIAVIPPLIIDYDNLSVWSSYIYNAASILVVSCPCALVLSVPMAYFVGIGEASKIKMLIKGSAYLEDLGKLDTVILDKTGTITKGNFVVDKVILGSTSIYKEEDIINFAGISEYNSLHPIATSILNKVDKNKLDISNYKNSEEIEGKGIKGLYKDKLLLVGNDKLLDEFHINYEKVEEIGTIIYVSYDSIYLGAILIKDQIKEDSIEAIKAFPKFGIKDSYMLTGDNFLIANDIASTTGIKNVKANLLPLDKVEEVKQIMSDKGNKIVGFIGDGVNDAPSMSLAKLGISMGGIGSDAAIEASDIVIMDDKLTTLLKGKKIARSTLNVVYMNIIFAIIVKFVAIIITASNVLGSYAMWLGIFADVGVTIICVLNSLRLMIHKK